MVKQPCSRVGWQAQCCTHPAAQIDHDLDHRDPILPLRDFEQDLYGTDPTQGTFAIYYRRPCRLYRPNTENICYIYTTVHHADCTGTHHPATLARSHHTSRIYLPCLPDLLQIMKPCTCPAWQIGDLSGVYNAWLPSWDAEREKIYSVSKKKSTENNNNNNNNNEEWRCPINGPQSQSPAAQHGLRQR